MDTCKEHVPIIEPIVFSGDTDGLVYVSDENNVKEPFLLVVDYSDVLYVGAQ